MYKDSELLNKFITDNKSNVFNEIVAMHQSLVYNACFKILKSQADVEDAAQAAFLVLIKKAGSLKNKDFLSFWLYKPFDLNFYTLYNPFLLHTPV